MDIFSIHINPLSPVCVFLLRLTPWSLDLFSTHIKPMTSEWIFCLHGALDGQVYFVFTLVFYQYQPLRPLRFLSASHHRHPQPEFLAAVSSSINIFVCLSVCLSVHVHLLSVRHTSRRNIPYRVIVFSQISLNLQKTFTLWDEIIYYFFNVTCHISRSHRPKNLLKHV